MDYNKVQENGPVNEIKNLEPLGQKWASFGWHVFEVNGHSIKDLVAAFDALKDIRGKPSVIIAHTIKGKGVSFMENNNHFHGVAPNQEERERALKELS